MAKALPPGLIVELGQFTWTRVWRLMMANLAPRNPAGDYIRPPSQFHQRVSPEPDSTFPAASGRYQLIVGMGCPWAHRTLVVRMLKGLTTTIPVLTVTPSPRAGGWVFAAENARDTKILGCQTLAQLYQQAQPGYSGRSTVPVLWDSQQNKIVNNESAEIIEILNAAFNAFAEHPELDLYPDQLQPQIDEWNQKIYPTVNNGVYRCGFAQTQLAYEQACNALFATLDAVEATLSHQHYLCGEQLTLADVRLFTTLIRFDLVYYGLFKCNRQRIQDYPHLANYLRELYQLPGIADTCDLDAIKQEYYGNLFPLNPGGIIPVGPDLEYLQTSTRA